MARDLKHRDDDEQLSAYYRQLAEHDLLTPDEERAMSRAIEEAEVLTWELLLTNPDVAIRVLDTLTDVEKPAKLTSLRRVLDEVRATKRSRRDVNLKKKLARAARQAARRLRRLDIDRARVDQVLATVGASKDATRASREAAATRDKFIRANLRLVVTMAKRYDRGDMTLADLIQEGNLGLMHAVSRFDYRRKLRFSTYACWWIRHAIGRARADKARVVRIPVHMVESQQSLEKVRQRLTAELGRPPSVEELSSASRVSVARLDEMSLYITGHATSLDSARSPRGAPTHDGDDRALHETLSDPNLDEVDVAEEMTSELMSAQLHRLMHQLSPIEVEVLKLRFGLEDDEELTFQEIANRRGLSRERIRQIQNEAIKKLRVEFDREGVDPDE